MCSIQYGKLLHELQHEMQQAPLQVPVGVLAHRLRVV